MNIDTIVRGIEQPKSFPYETVLKSRKRTVEPTQRDSKAYPIKSKGKSKGIDEVISNDEAMHRKDTILSKQN